MLSLFSHFLHLPNCNPRSLFRMLIYWEHIYTDELYDTMAVSCDDFPCDTLRYSNFTTTYEVTDLTRFANYVAGIVMILGFLISTILNPLVFYHFCKESSSMVIVDLLFKILAISDFLTNIYAPIFYAHQIFHAEIQASVKRTWAYMLAQAFTCNLGCISQSATTLLAVARYLRLRAPFININKYIFLAIFLFYAGIMTAITITGKYYFYTATEGNVEQGVMTSLSATCFYLNLVQCFVGNFFSVLCVTSLFKGKPDSDDKIAMKTYEMRKKGCVTILLINLPYLISLIFALVAAITDYKHLRALMFTFLPVATSMVNPIILCWRNTGIRKTLKKKGKEHLGRLFSRYTEQDDYTMLDDKNNKTMASEI